MLSDWKAWLLILLGLSGLALTGLNISFYIENRDRQQNVATRQQLVNEASQLSNFNNQFILALANLAAQTNDENIKQLLEDYGVTYTVNETPQEEDSE